MEQIQTNDELARKLSQYYDQITVTQNGKTITFKKSKTQQWLDALTTPFIEIKITKKSQP